jgi:hypothetical protein
MAFAAVLVKCLFNGYEYSTTTLAMMAVPLVYYGVLRRASVRGIAVSLLAAAAGAGLAIAVSLALLCVQIAQVDGSLRAGVDHIIYSLEKRSHADSEEFPTRLAPSLEASTASVLATYLNGTFFDTGSLGTRLEQQRARESFRIRYWHLIVVFLAATGALCLPRRRRTGDPNAGSRAALAAATWFSVLAPLSWFVVFKAHSSIHTRINFIVWQMPFVLFGFAVCGAALTGLLKSFARQSHGTPRR